MNFGPTATVVCDYNDDGSFNCLLNNGKIDAKEEEVTVESIDVSRIGFTDDAIWSTEIESPSSDKKTGLRYDIEMSFDNEQIECHVKDKTIECKNLED